MKKKSICILFVTILFSYNHIASFDFDKFMQDIFGTKALQEKKTQPTEEKKGFPSAQKKQPPSQQKPRDVLPTAGTKNLSFVTQNLSQLVNKTKSNIFTPEFKEEVIPFIQGKSSPLTRAKEQKTKEKITDIPLLKNKGVYGFISLAKLIQSKKAYRTILESDESKPLHNQISNTLNKTYDLIHDISSLEENQQKKAPSEEDILMQYLLPKKERKSTKLIDQEERKNIQRRLIQLFQNEIPRLNEKLQAIIENPKAQEAIAKKIKTRRELEEQAVQQSQNRYGRMPGEYRGGYPGSRYAGQPRFPWQAPWGSNRYSPQAPSSPYNQSQNKRPSTEKTESSKEKKSPSKSYRGWPSNKKKEDKEKKKLAQTNIISLMEQATALLQEIGSSTPATTKIYDPKIKVTLENKQNQIRNLLQIVSEIERRKTSIQATQDKKLDSWRKAENQYKQAFQQNVYTLIILGKYTFIALPENERTGRYSLTISQNEPQKQIRSIYQILSQKFPLQNKQALLKQLQEHFNKMFIEQMQLLQALGQRLNQNTHLLLLNNENILKILERILQTVTSATKEPFKIAIGITNTQRRILYNIQSFFAGKFSERLQQAHHANQRNFREDEYNQLIEEGIKILQANNLLQDYRLFQSFIIPYLPPEANARWNNLIQEIPENDQAKLNRMRTKVQYHKSAYTLNECDKGNLLVTETLRQMNLNPQPPARPLTIIEALWATNIDAQNKITAPQTCDVQTHKWQEIVNEQIQALAGENINYANFDTGKLGNGQVGNPLVPGNKQLLIRYKIRNRECQIQTFKAHEKVILRCNGKGSSLKIKVKEEETEKEIHLDPSERKMTEIAIES